MSLPTGCREAVDRLWAYLDHELDELDEHAVESHLRFCLRCCGELAFAREVRGALVRARPVLPADVHERLDLLVDQLAPADPKETTPP